MPMEIIITDLSAPTTGTPATLELYRSSDHVYQKELRSGTTEIYAANVSIGRIVARVSHQTTKQQKRHHASLEFRPNADTDDTSDPMTRKVGITISGPATVDQDLAKEQNRVILGTLALWLSENYDKVDADVLEF